MVAAVISGFTFGSFKLSAKNCLIFAAFAFISFVLTGKLFYAVPKKKSQT